MLAKPVDLDAAGRSWWILVVEENPAVRGLLVAGLSGERGLMAWGVGSGPAALETCGSILPDALLLDTALPDTDCHELAGQVRAIPALASVVLIAMTPAGDSQPPAERALAAGCDAAVAKAVDLHELVATLLRCLGPGP